MERRSTRNSSVLSRERSASLASSRSGSSDVTPLGRGALRGRGRAGRGSSDSEGTDISSECSEETSQCITVSLARNVKMTKDRVIEALNKKEVKTLPEIR